MNSAGPSQDIEGQQFDDLGLYIHVPFCRQKCPYCGFYSEPIAGHDVGRVIQAMLRELDTAAATGKIPPSGKVSTIYIGGGSPSCLSEPQLISLIDGIIARIVITAQTGITAQTDITAQAIPTVEFTVEVNPGQIQPHTLEIMRQKGVNRLSVGGQSFDQAELDFLGRPYTPSQIISTIHQAQKIGFKNISLDLIFALPGQSLDLWQAHLATASQLGIQHLSAYSLTYEPDTVLEKALDQGKFQRADEELERTMYYTTIDYLHQGGFEQYEISNFAQLGFPCQHNLRYWANLSYLGIGPGACSYFPPQRTSNIKDVLGYTQLIEKNTPAIVETDQADPLQTACQTAVLMLRRIIDLNLDDFFRRTGFQVQDLFSEPIKRYLQLELMTLQDGWLRLTRDALAIADSILCDFAAV